MSEVVKFLSAPVESFVVSFLVDQNSDYQVDLCNKNYLFKNMYPKNRTCKTKHQKTAQFLSLPKATNYRTMNGKSSRNCYHIIQKKETAEIKSNFFGL